MCTYFARIMISLISLFTWTHMKSGYWLGNQKKRCNTLTMLFLRILFDSEFGNIQFVWENYTTWPKVCGHLQVEHLIHKWWALIWSWSPPPSAIIASTLLGRHCCGDVLPFSHKRISEVGHWCWAFRPGSQSVFQFIPGVQWGWGQGSVQVSQVIPHRSRQAISVWTSLCARGIVMLKQKRSFPKLLPHS